MATRVGRFLLSWLVRWFSVAVHSWVRGVVSLDRRLVQFRIRCEGSVRLHVVFGSGRLLLSRWSGMRPSVSTRVSCSAVVRVPGGSVGLVVVGVGFVAGGVRSGGRLQVLDVYMPVPLPPRTPEIHL
jgi:hypothetical protein